MRCCETHVLPPLGSGQSSGAAEHRVEARMFVTSIITWIISCMSLPQSHPINASGCSVAHTRTQTRTAALLVSQLLRDRNKEQDESAENGERSLSAHTACRRRQRRVASRAQSKFKHNLSPGSA